MGEYNYTFQSNIRHNPTHAKAIDEDRKNYIVFVPLMGAEPAEPGP